MVAVDRARVERNSTVPATVLLGGCMAEVSVRGKGQRRGRRRRGMRGASDLTPARRWLRWQVGDGQVLGALVGVGHGEGAIVHLLVRVVVIVAVAMVSVAVTIVSGAAAMKDAEVTIVPGAAGAHHNGARGRVTGVDVDSINVS